MSGSVSSSSDDMLDTNTEDVMSFMCIELTTLDGFTTNCQTILHRFLTAVKALPSPEYKSRLIHSVARGYGERLDEMKPTPTLKN